MKPIREETRERRLERALLVIEGVVMESADDFVGHRGKTPAGFTDKQYIATLQRIITDAYEVSHAASGRCCEGGRSKWLDKIPKLERQLKKAGLVDVEKCLKSKPKY